MTEYENMSQVWAQRPEGGTEGELIKVGGDTYKWNEGFRNWLLFEEAYKQTTLDGDLNVNRHINAGGNMTVRGKGVIEGDLEVKGRVNFGASGADIDRIGGDLTIEGDTTINKNLKVKGKVEAESVNTPFLGLFSTIESLKSKYPTTTVGNYAVVGKTIPGPVYRYEETGWQATGETGGGNIDVNLSDYYIKEETYSRTELNGRIIGVITLTKDINDYSELDRYSDYGSLGKWAVYHIKQPNLVGYLNVLKSFGGTIVQELESFKTLTDATTMFASTKMIRSKGISDPSWGAWKTYQSSFIGNNGNFDEENSVPNMKMFNEAIKYKEVAEWSGIVINAGVVSENSVDESDPSNIAFAQDKGRFIYRKGSTYYDNWLTRSKYVDDNGNITNNIFKTAFNTYYIATSSNAIEKLPERRYELNGDIKELETGMPVDIEDYLGSVSEFCNAVKNNYTITSGGLILQVFNVEYNGSVPSNVSMFVIYNGDLTARTLKYKTINVQVVNGATFGDRTVAEYTLTPSV